MYFLHRRLHGPTPVLLPVPSAHCQAALCPVHNLSSCVNEPALQLHVAAPPAFIFVFKVYFKPAARILQSMSSSAETAVNADAEAAAAAAEEQRLKAQAKKLKIEAAAAGEKKRLAKLAAKWKEPGPLKLPALAGMKVRASAACSIAHRYFYRWRCTAPFLCPHIERLRQPTL